MIATAFDEENDVLGRPPSMTADQCDPLPIWRGEVAAGVPVVVSCWKMTREELEEINRTGRVWLMVLGVTMQPVMLNGIKPLESRPT